MPQSALNFSAWLERLGLKRGQEPALIGSVQPTMVVSDQRDNVSPAWGLRGAVGHRQAAVVGEVAQFRLVVRAPIQFRAWGGAPAAAAPTPFILNNTGAPALSAGTLLPWYTARGPIGFSETEGGPALFQSQWSTETQVGLGPTTLRPAFTCVAGDQFDSGWIFAQPNSHWEFTCQTANLEVYWRAVCIEYPDNNPA